jgi:glyoxylase-like metal-dependent hydrolase (beta-lactamase superfamily II)
MRIQLVPCGFLKVRALEMIKPWTVDQIRQKYPVDDEGFIKLSMNALVVTGDSRVVLFDPGTADFLPGRLKKEYGFEMPLPLEDVLLEAGYVANKITDVVFTHLHFDHGSGAFERVPGKIRKRFPNARYHVPREHYQYALKPHRVEANSFSTFLFKHLEEIHWIENWDMEEINFHVFHGHTKGMVVPEIITEEGKVYFASDLIPMKAFLEAEVFCGYDLDPELVMREKREFLSLIEPGSRILFYHDSLSDSIFY